MITMLYKKEKKKSSMIETETDTETVTTLTHPLVTVLTLQSACPNPKIGSYFFTSQFN